MTDTAIPPTIGTGAATEQRSAPAGGLPPTITVDLLERLGALVSAAPDAPRSVSRAPYTLGELASLPTSSPADVAAAFATARRVAPSWAQTPVAERAAIMLRFHDLVLARQDEALDLMQAENGKTRRDAFLEVLDIAVTARYYARAAAKLLNPRRRRGAFPVLTRTVEQRHPKGVVAVISPWNYPLSMAAGDTIPALMAGNAVVQKPDTQTSLTALWALDLLREAGLPADVWQIVIGRGSSIGDTLMDNADYVMFTGSTESGARIAADAGQRLTGASLELGGKNAMVVLPDADVRKVADGAIHACFSSTGQLCVSIERLYVHRDLYAPLLDRLKCQVGKMKLGAGYDYGFDMGSLTNESQLQNVVDHVDDALSKGAVAVAGGRARPDLGPLFYEPTVLSGVTPEMKLYADETFGPVVSVYPFDTEDEAVALANDTVYGLNASIWTRDAARGRALAGRLRAGTVNINDAFAAAWGSVDSPMGGMGKSGLGRRHGSEGLLKYTEAQTVAQQRVQGFTAPRGLPWRVWAAGLTGSLRLLKQLGLK